MEKEINSALDFSFIQRTSIYLICPICDHAYAIPNWYKHSDINCLACGAKFLLSEGYATKGIKLN